MNFNTFFLDKLSSVNQSPNSSSGKTSHSTYLFSDIMKVQERENETNLKSQSDSVNPGSNAIESSPFSSNVIECNDKKLKTLSDFINSFIASTEESINISEVKQDSQPVAINKKTFLMSSAGMEDFLKGLVETINLNSSDGLNAAVTPNKENSGELKKLGAVVESDKKNISLLEKKLEGDLAADPSTGAILQSILDFLSNYKTLSLSFKSNLEKVNINFYELPEANFETKINLEKLTADFIKEGKKIGNTESESSNSIPKEELVNALLANSAENTQAGYPVPSAVETNLLLKGLQPGEVNTETSLKPVGINSPQNENVYKTEVIEIAYRQNVLMSNLNVEDPLKAGKLSTDQITLSGFTFNDSEISDAKFRLNNNLSMKLNTDISAVKNIYGSTSFMKTEVTDTESSKVLSSGIKSESISGTVVTPEFKSASLKNELPLISNPDQAVSSKSNEKQEEINSTKLLLNELNGKLVGVEFKKSMPVSVDAAKKSETVSKKDASESSEEKDFMNIKLGDNLKNASQSANQIAGDSEISDKKMMTNELNVKLVGVDVKKAEGKEDSAKSVKEIESTKSVSAENDKENAKAVSGAENNSTGGKDSEKQKSNDGFKNVLQSADQINGNDSDKFKIAPELKTSQEVMKTIKTNEIIPEFSKIIQAGEKQTMTFQLTPENLGKVKLIVELVENQINTRIEVENDHVKHFIQSNLEQLKQNLQSSGIQMSTVNVSLTESDQKFTKSFSQRKKSGEKIGKVKASDEQTRPTHKSLGYNTYEFLA